METTLAFRGSNKYHKEIIEILEILGGENLYECIGNSDRNFYYIDTKGRIWNENEENLIITEFETFTYETFNNKFPYRPGDRVITTDGNTFYINGLRWSNGTIVYDGVMTSWFIPIETTIWPKHISHKIENVENCKTDNKSENSKEMNKPNKEINIGQILPVMTSEIVDGMDAVSFGVAEDWDFKVDPKTNKLYFFKKINKFPLQYLDCLEILGLDYLGDRIELNGVTNEEYNKYEALIKLKRCRDAYWKIDNNWKYEKDKNGKYPCCYGIYYNEQTKKIDICDGTLNIFLKFSSAKIRDKFLKNFGWLIDLCKEFL